MEEAIDILQSILYIKWSLLSYRSSKNN